MNMMKIAKFVWQDIVDQMRELFFNYKKITFLFYVLQSKVCRYARIIDLIRN